MDYGADVAGLWWGVYGIDLRNERLGLVQSFGHLSLELILLADSTAAWPSAATRTVLITSSAF